MARYAQNAHPLSSPGAVIAELDLNPIKIRAEAFLLARAESSLAEHLGEESDMLDAVLHATAEASADDVPELLREVHLLRHAVAEDRRSMLLASRFEHLDPEERLLLAATDPEVYWERRAMVAERERDALRALLGRSE